MTANAPVRRCSAFFATLYGFGVRKIASTALADVAYARCAAPRVVDVDEDANALGGIRVVSVGVAVRILKPAGVAPTAPTDARAPAVSDEAMEHRASARAKDAVSRMTRARACVRAPARNKTSKFGVDVLKIKLSYQSRFCTHMSDRYVVKIVMIYMSPIF